MAEGKRRKRRRRRYRAVWGRRIIIFMLCISFCIGVYFVLSSRGEFLCNDGVTADGHSAGVLSVLGIENSGENILEDKIPVILQNPELTSGCEATAAVMLLSAYGFEVDKEEFANALPWCGLEEYRGRVYACNPQDAFVGSPYSTGYGVFSDIVAKTMQKFINQSGEGAQAKDITGASQQTILKYVEKGMPVCVWVTMDLREVQYKSGWYIKDGDIYTEEYFEWPSGEHCMLLTGYQDGNVIVHDPLQGKMEYDSKTFFQRYKDMGCQAIIIIEE